MKTTLQAGMRILISRYICQVEVAETQYMSPDRQESSAHRRQL